jgi:hypothetical protein
MKKLNDTTKMYLKNAVDVAKLLGIEEFIVEPDKICGTHADKLAVIITDVEMDIGCSAIGVNRLDVLANRLKLVNGDIICTFNNELSDALHLKLKSGKTQVDYKCAQSKMIKTVRSFNYTDVYEVTFNKDIVDIVTKAQASMKAEEVTLICDDGVLTYILTDVLNDTFKFESESEVFSIDDTIDDVNFVYKYPAKMFIKILKNCSLGKFNVNQRGSIHVVLSDIGVLIPAIVE